MTEKHTPDAIQRLAQEHTDLLKKAGPHGWGMLTVENALAERDALLAALRAIVECDASAIPVRGNEQLLRAIADGHDVLAKLEGNHGKA